MIAGIPRLANPARPDPMPCRRSAGQHAPNGADPTRRHLFACRRTL